MSLLIFALPAAVVLVLLCARVQAQPRDRRQAAGHVPSRSVASLGLAVSLISLVAAGDFLLKAAEEKGVDTAKRPAPAKGEKLQAPANWPAGHPLPQVASNCARCHLTAGRELTLAVRDFAHSVHDLNQLTCYDCHGGNTEDDVRAHEEEFGFIGTKLSAHIQRCGECHEDAVEVLAAGPHHWDFSKRINTKYPTCIDCHGNHDIGNPPSDFKLTSVCLDCHRQLATKYPQIGSVVAENDKLWQTIIKFRGQTADAPERVPEEFADRAAALRQETMQLVHGAKEVSPDTAAALNKNVKQLRDGLEAWLKKAQP